jgi:hypothetical protein
MYNHEREYIVRIWSYLSMTAREEMLNMLLGMLGGNPSAAIGPDGRLSSLLPSNCQPIVAESNAQSKTEKTKGKPPKVNSWDRDILRDLTGVSEFGNLTSAQRAKDPEATLRLLSTASGTIARGKRNFNLTDGEITKGINQLLKDDGTWDIPAMKALYQKPEKPADGGGKEGDKSRKNTTDDVNVSGSVDPDSNQDDMELETQESGVPPSGDTGTPLTTANDGSASACRDNSLTTVATTTNENTTAVTTREQSRQSNSLETNGTVVVSQNIGGKRRRDPWPRSSDEDDDSDDIAKAKQASLILKHNNSRNTNNNNENTHVRFEDQTSDGSSKKKKGKKKKKKSNDSSEGSQPPDGKPPEGHPPPSLGKPEGGSNH